MFVVQICNAGHVPLCCWKDACCHQDRTDARHPCSRQRAGGRLNCSVSIKETEARRARRGKGRFYVGGKARLLACFCLVTSSMWTQDSKEKLSRDLPERSQGGNNGQCCSGGPLGDLEKTRVFPSCVIYGEACTTLLLLSRGVRISCWNLQQWCHPWAVSASITKVNH